MELIITVILFVIACIAACFIFKKVVKVLLIFFAIGVIITATLGALLYLDIKDYAEHFPKEPNVLILQEQDNILTAMIFTLENEEFTLIEDPSILNAFMQSKKESELQKLGFYKAIIIDTQFLEKNLPEQIQGIPKQTYLSMLTQGQVPEYIAEYIETEDKEQETQAALAGLGMAHILQDDKTALLQGFKDGDIKVYKQTILVHAIKQLPIGLAELIV